MPSSISSSEQRAEGRRFALATLAWGALFFGLYAGWFALAQPTVRSFQNYSARNASRAERFLHADGQRAVLVGSSLTQLIPQEALGGTVHNMGFSRESALTGLAIVAAAPIKPEVVIIELNYVLREINGEFIEMVMDPVRHAVREVIPVIRTEGQPINVLLSGVRAAFGRSLEQRMDQVVDPQLLTPLLSQRIAGFQVPPSDADLDAAVNTLSELIGALETSGVLPLLLMMPVEPELEVTPRARAVRERLERAFPPDRHRWVDTTREQPYRTTDSEHLLFRDAWFVGERLAETVAQLP